MTRPLRVAAAQLGPIARGEDRPAVVERLCRLMRQAADARVQLVVYPELALTPFFPRRMIHDAAELEAHYEREIPPPALGPLRDLARRSGIGLAIGVAERVEGGHGVRHHNTALLFGPDAALIGRYRKIHLPGDRDERPGAAFQHLEKRCFDTGDLGFPAWRAFGGVAGLLICNDRRWPEAWRVLGLQGTELVLIGYNTPLHNPEAPALDRHVAFHHALVIQAGCYQNGTWAVAAGKAGVEDGQAMLADSMVVAPSGEIVARAASSGDELVVADIDLDDTVPYKATIFDFAAHREPQAYRLIVERKGAGPPEDPAPNPG